jgi:hypothetical protein
VLAGETSSGLGKSSLDVSGSSTESLKRKLNSVFIKVDEDMEKLRGKQIFNFSKFSGFSRGSQLISSQFSKARPDSSPLYSLGSQNCPQP